MCNHKFNVPQEGKPYFRLDAETGLNQQSVSRLKLLTSSVRQHFNIGKGQKVTSRSMRINPVGDGIESEN